VHRLGYRIPLGSDDMAGPPEVSGAEQVYGEGEVDAGAEALSNVRAAFQRRFQGKPEGVARAPGRVNLIGEHVDYEGFSVLPCALSLDIVLAFARCDASEGVSACSASPSAFPDVSFPASASTPIEPASLGWATYVACGFKGVFDFLLDDERLPHPSGLKILVLGRIPSGSGLSSSSALVCASALATAHAHGVKLSKSELAFLCATCERHAGAESGGMDQAISFFGERGRAMHISFSPLRAEPVTLPSSLRVVVANSLAESHKAETAASRYNLRVLECALATKCLLACYGKEFADCFTLREAQQALSLSSPEMERAVKGSLKEKPYKVDEIQQLLGVSVQSVFASNVSLMESLHANQSDGFKLQQRALHVFSEVSRTQAFVQAAADGDTATLAGAIDASHESLRDWYECSCPELDQLVTAMREGGARGARLTGAGWGGCAVAVVEESMLEGMLEHVKRAFYNNIGTDAIFATVPGIGACLFYES